MGGRGWSGLVLVAVAICLSTGVALAQQGDSEGGAQNARAEKLSAPPAREPGVELKNRRTATSKTFALPNGMRQTRIYQAPIHYRDSHGDWKPIDGRLMRAADGSLRNGVNRFDLRLPSRLSTEPMRLSVGEHWVSAQALDLPTAEVSVDGGLARYGSPEAPTAVELSPLPNGVKEEIVISDPGQPSRYRFELKASDGLMPTLTDAGAIEFRDDEGKAVIVLPAPLMYDSEPGVPEVSSDVHYELDSAAGGAWALTVDADREWLAEDSRVWPVSIDPSLHVPSPVLDCAFGGSEWGGEGWRQCGSSGFKYIGAADRPGEYDEWKRSLLRFDLGTIPSTSEVASATIGLHAPWAVTNTSGLELRRATKSWTSSVNWKKYDGTNPWTSQGGDFTSVGGEILTEERGAQAGWWDFSEGIVPLAKGWISGSLANQGALLKLKDQPRDCWYENGLECTQRWATLESSAAADQEKRPYMDVVYYPPAPSSAKLTAPTDGHQAARRLKLKSAWNSGVTGVTYQYRVYSNEPFQTMPANLVRDEQGQPVSWPLAVEGTQSEPVFFDLLNAPTTYEEGLPERLTFEVRALFEGAPGLGGYSTPVKATLDPGIGGARDAIAEVGPGTVNLITGNLVVSRTDVSISSFGSGLEFSRTHNSRQSDTGTQWGVLGRGWKPTIPVEAAGGSAWQKLSEVAASEEEKEYGLNDYVLLTDIEGVEIDFEKGGGGDYVSPTYAQELKLTKEGSNFVLADIDGNRTVFAPGGSSGEYRPSEISQTGGTGNKTRMVYSTSGAKLLTKVIAPTPAGVTCTETAATTTTGCRVLTFEYQSATAWGAPAFYGDRLASITFHAYPAAAKEISRYNYDKEGRLTEVWDPRVSPALEEKYSYHPGGPIKTITPPGEESWTLEYSSDLIMCCSLGVGRLRAVKRPSLIGSPSIAQTTIVYGVPLTGEDAPHDMSGSSIAQWGQGDVPVDATAIFPPDQIPASTPESYSRATIYYLDAEGMRVNEALPAGAGSSAPITTTETDEHGNVVRELSAQNRLRALAAEDSVARSKELDTHRTFSTDGLELLEEWGPLHETRLQSGEAVQARLHRTFQYDQGAPTPPTGTPMPYLPTYETTAAVVSGKGGEADVRATKTEYDWTLRQPTDVIVDPGGLNLRTKTVYNSTSGLVTERRLPENPEGGDAHSTRIIYYTAGTNPIDGVCGNQPTMANLPCKMGPAVQPETEGQPDLPVTKYTYNWLGHPKTITRIPGEGNNQATTIEYDLAGRETIRYETLGIPKLDQIPIIRTSYSSTTGRPVKQWFEDPCEEECEPWDDQAVAASYDTLGRVTEYEDADGNTSTATYDLLGRPVTTYDGKGTQTRTYDATSGLLVELEDSAAGAFTASYDADGQLTDAVLPNGLIAETTYDETGSPIHLAYEKTSGCSLDCIWLDFDVDESIHGQWLQQESTLATQQFGYDAAGRLTLVKDTPAGGECTTRAYSFDDNTNREAMVTRAPGEEGSCDTTSEGTVQEYKYDDADRLLGSEIAYDGFGRITSLPEAFAGGGTLTTSYFANDLVRSQTQDGVTNTYELDAALRQRKRVQNGEAETVEIYHYAGPADSPAWIDHGSSWTRIIGVPGAIAIEDSATEEVTLQLPNLHGDVVATASLDPKATELLSTQEFDEYGNPKGELTPKFGWLGARVRRTELSSGVIQMGVRSYVPAMGRFLSPDPVPGGSANAYEYAAGDPVNNFDLTGEKCAGKDRGWIERCMKKKIRNAKKSVRKQARRLRRLVRGARASQRVNLGGFPRFEFPVIDQVQDFLEAIPSAIKQVDEKTSCTGSGVVAGSAGTLLEKKAESIFGVGTKLTRVAQKVGGKFTVWGAAFAAAGAAGIC